jgi:transcriptional regulator with XRE-family HTH domain
VSNQFLLFQFGGVIHHMQLFSTIPVYIFTMLPDKPTTDSHLSRLREQAGLTVRELARQLDTDHTTILYWERTGKVAKAEFLLPLSRILGVTIEEILGEPRPRRVAIPGGKLGQAFEAAAKLPRSKQEKIIALLDAFVDQHSLKGNVATS